MRDDEAFRVLGIPPSATREEIRAAFRRLVKAWHPDRHASQERRAIAEERVKRVIDAYRSVRNGVVPPKPESETQGAPATRTSMFSVDPVAPSPFRASPKPTIASPEEVRLRRRQIAREWLPRFATIVAIIAASVWSSGWWLPKVWNIAITTGVIDLVPLPRLQEHLEKTMTLADRVACYSEKAGSYELCITLRLIDHQYGLPPHPRRRPGAFQFALCGKLQQMYSGAAYSNCVAELRAARRD